MVRATLIRVFAQVQELELLWPLGSCIKACPGLALKLGSRILSSSLGFLATGAGGLLWTDSWDWLFPRDHHQLHPTSRGLRWLACFLGGLAFPRAQLWCAHCLRVVGGGKCPHSQIRWSNGVPCWFYGRLHGFAARNTNVFLTWERRLTFFFLLSTVLGIYCCRTNEWFKTTMLFLWVRNFVWLGTSSSGFPKRLSWDVSKQLRDSLLRWYIHMPGKLVLVVGRGPQHLSMGTSPELLAWSHKETDLPQSEWFKKLKRKLRWLLWLGPGSQTLPLAQYSHELAVIQCGSKLHEGMNSRRWGSLVPSWRLATTKTHHVLGCMQIIHNNQSICIAIIACIF